MTATIKTHASRLHVAYAKLTFKCDSSDQDIRREDLFQRLVLHHLLGHVMLTQTDWHDVQKEEECTYNFIVNYAKALWPGSMADRSHLANPPMMSKSTRSFVGSVDSHWSARRNGKPKAKADDQVPARGYGVGSHIGGRAHSKIGKAFFNYANVLLEPGLTGARVEDPALLIAGILSIDIGPEIPAAQTVEQQVPTKMEDGSEFMPIKVEDVSD